MLCNDAVNRQPMVRTTIPANPDHRVVTMWSDISSPAAALALHTLRARAEDRGVRLLIDHRAYPTELLDRVPTVKGVVDGESAAIGALRPELGWRPWRGADATYPVTMLLPMEAVQAAKRPEVGGLLGSAELDAALRRAFLVDGQCISLYSVMADTATQCPAVNSTALLDAITSGAGRANVMSQWATAARGAVAGSPHLFTQGGFAEFSPGVSVRWPDGNGIGTPVVEDGGVRWADRLLDTLRP